MVVFSDGIYCGHDVQKVNMSAAMPLAARTWASSATFRMRTSTFTIAQTASTPPPPSSTSPESKSCPKSACSTPPVGTDAELIDAMLGLGVKGNVLCSGGAGGTSQAIADKLGEASGASVPVISCSRIAGGLIDVYNARDAIQLSSHAEADRAPLRALYNLVEINCKLGIDSHRDGFLERIHHRRRVLGESGDHRPAHRGVDDPVLPHTGLAIEVLLGANTPRPSFHAKDVSFYPLKIVYDRVFYNNRLPH